MYKFLIEITTRKSGEKWWGMDKDSYKTMKNKQDVYDYSENRSNNDTM